jgi:hypothetical protein
MVSTILNRGQIHSNVKELLASTYADMTAVSTAQLAPGSKCLCLDSFVEYILSPEMAWVEIPAQGNGGNIVIPDLEGYATTEYVDERIALLINNESIDLDSITELVKALEEGGADIVEIRETIEEIIKALAEKCSIKDFEEFEVNVLAKEQELSQAIEAVNTRIDEIPVVEVPIVQHATIDLSPEFVSVNDTNITVISGDMKLQSFDVKENFTEDLTEASIAKMIKQGKMACLGGYIFYTKAFDESTIEKFYFTFTDIDASNGVAFVGTLYRIGENGVVSVPELTNGTPAINIISDFNIALTKVEYKSKSSYQPGVVKPAVIDLTGETSEDGEPIYIDLSGFGTPVAENVIALEQDLTIIIPANITVDFGDKEIDLNGHTFTITGAGETSKVQTLVIAENCEGTLKLNNVIFDGGNN